MADDFRKRALNSALAERAYGSVFSSQYAEAQKSAQANEAARRLGIDADLVESDMPNMLAEDRLRKRIAQTQTNPAYARIMANRRLAASAIDDDELPKVAERAQKQVEVMSPAWIGGVVRSTVVNTGRRAEGLFGSYSRLMSSVYSSVGFDSGAAIAKRGAVRGERIAARTATDEGQVTWEAVKKNPLLAPVFGAQMMIQSAPDMALIATGVGLPAYFGARSAEIGQQRAEADGRKDATGADMTKAAPFAAASIFLDRLGLKGITAGIKNATGKAIFSAATREGGTEYLQSGLEYLGARAGTAAGVDPNEMVDQMYAGGVGGLFGGGMMAATGAVVKTYAQRQRDVENATGVNRIMEAAAASQTRTNNPSDFRDALNQLVGGTEASELYVPVETILNSIGETDAPLEEHSIWGPYAQQIADAQELGGKGGDVVLSLADVATDLAGTPTWEAIRNDTRTRPGGSSITEAKSKATPEELQAMTERVAGDISKAMAYGQNIKARQVVGRFAENIVEQGPQATAVNRMLTGWLVTRFNADAAKRQAAGEEPITLEQFGESNLPTAVRMLQAQFESGEAGSTTLSATGESDGPQATGSDQAATSAVRQSGGLRGVPGLLDGQAGPLAGIDRPLEGAPQELTVPGRGKVAVRPLVAAREAAGRVAARLGVRYSPARQYAKLDTARAARIATAFDEMAHDPTNPEVAAAYDAMINETLVQFEEILATGLEIEFIRGEDPYALSPRLAILDATENNHLWVFPTEGGFGSGQVTDSPMLAPTDYVIDGHALLVNDVFRIVHDYFGHIKEGHGFRAEGEENAWQSHAAMYSPLARRAMTTETRGQNSWVNFGPAAEKNATASGGDTVYAEQKVGLLPEWVSEEGRLSDGRVGSDDRAGGLVGGNGNAIAERGGRLEGDIQPLDAPRADQDGNVTLAHFTTEEGLTQTDPSFWGKSGRFLPREESSRKGRAPDRTYFGLNTGEPGGYRREFGETHPIYSDKPMFEVAASIPLAKLYDMNGDPDGLKAKGREVPKDATGRYIYNGVKMDGVSLYENLIKDAGYSGYWIKNDRIGMVAAVFEPVRVVPKVEGQTLDQTAVPLLANPLSIEGKVTVKAVGEALTAHHMKTEGRALYPENDEADYTRVLDALRDEMRAQMQQPHSGVGWYSADVQKAIEMAAQVYPTLLSEPSHRDLFLTFAGILSNGNTPEQAFMLSAEAFEAFLVDGKVPVNRATAATVRGAAVASSKSTGKPVGWSVRNAANEQQLALVNYLIERDGSLEAALDWLITPQPRAAINEVMLTSGLWKAGRYTTKKEIAGADTPGYLAFGEKLGRYTMGLQGYEIDAGDVTIDLWYTRTYRRHVGRLLETPVGPEGVVGGPTDNDRRVIFRLSGDLASEFDLPPGDVQAVLWFWEKRLWGAQGVRTSEGTNSSGAAKLLRSKGIDPDDGARGDAAGVSRGEAAPVDFLASARQPFAVGTYSQTVDLESEPFQEWFGDSKVVDKNGAPLVVYHGTTKAGFDRFNTDGSGKTSDTGAFFTTSVGGASTYSGTKKLAQVSEFDDFDPKSDGERGNYAVYLSLQNPLIVDFNGANWDSRGGQEWFVQDQDGEGLEYFTDQEMLDEFVANWDEDENGPLQIIEGNDNPDRESTDDIARQAREDGYDGVIFENISDEGPFGQGYAWDNRIFVAFAPEQIKSVNNRGTFDPNDPRILNQKKRGNISIIPDEFGMMESALIRAFESANFSTAVHELGHFFLEDLRRRALASDATDQEIADWQTFKQWGASLGQTIADDSPIPVDAHEYFARGFEQYTWEGRAPTAALRGLFLQLREFMKKLYTRASQFNAPITPEIREVMGRMIASDSEVAEQTREMNLAAGKIEELMTPDERRIFADLNDEAREDARDKARERALSALRQEKTAEVRERKDQIKQEVSAEVDEMPLMRALKLLKVGIPQTDGTFIKVRLGREQLRDIYGDDVLDTLPRLVPEIHSDRDAQDVDTVAGLSGFESGDALIKALQAHAEAQAEMKEGGDRRSPRSRMVDDAVEDRVREEIGDPFETLEEEVNAALANERQGDAISLELRAIARKTGKKPTPWKLAKEFAAKLVAQSTSAEAVSGKAIQMYTRNASRAGQETTEAIIKGDMEEAFAAKQRQVLNLALLSEAKIAKDKVEAAQRRLKKIASRPAIPSVDQDYLEQAQALLEDVNMGDESRPAIQRRKSFEDWYLQQVEEGKDPVVPKEYANLLGKGNWKDLSIESFLELDTAVGQIIALGRLKQTLRDGREIRDFNEAVVEMAERLNFEVEGRKVTNENDPSRSFMGALKSKIRSADSWMVTARSLVSWFDGNDSTGPWHRLLLNPFGEAQGRADDLMRDYGEVMNAMIEALPKGQLKALKRKVDTPELINNIRDHPGRGQPFVFHMDQIVVMAMNWGNEGNRQRLLDGYGWQAEQVEAVFDRLMTKEYWDFVAGTWDVINRLWPDLVEMERRVNGVAPEKIEGTTVATKFGTYEGGYFPIVYDSQYSSRVEQDAAAKLSPGGGLQQVAVRSGASHNRVEAVKGRPLLLTIGLITNHMTEVVHDITHREAVHQAKRILTDDRIRTAIITKFGKEYSDALSLWLKNIAHPGVAFSEAARGEVSFGRHMTTGLSVVGLGLRITTILVQPLGLLNVASRVGGKHLLMEGIWTAMRRPAAVYNEVTAKSAMMRSRFSNIDTSMQDIIANNGKTLEKMGMGSIISASGAFRPIAFMDSLVATAGWIAAYNQGLQGKAYGSGPMSEDEAIAYADEVVLSTQGGGGVMDRSAMMNANPFVRMFYPFFSFANAMFNQQRDAVRLMSNGGVDNKVEGARRAWWVFIVPVLVQALLFGEGPEGGDDDDVTAEDWMRYLAGALMVGNTYSLPLAGPIVNAWGNGYGYRSSSLQGVGEDVVKAGKDVVALATEEDEELSGTTVKKLFGIAGITFHKALGQPGTTAGGLLEYARGNETPEDAGDWYELLAKGRTSKGPTSMEQMMGEEVE